MTPEEVIVREATAKDRGEVARIFSESFAGSWQYWSLRLLDVLKVLVAEVNGRVVGAAELYVTDVRGFGRVGVIAFIAVDERYRRRGVGSRLVEAAERLFEDMGCRYALHPRGSEVFEELEGPLYAYEDDVVMLKRLRRRGGKSEKGL